MFIYWLSYLWFPFALACLVRMWGRAPWSRPVTLMALLVSLIPAYARFVEPRVLLVEETSIDLTGGRAAGPEMTAVLVADLHIGKFGNTVPVERIVRRIEELDPDIVFIAGDFTLSASDDQIETAYDPLSRLSMPVFAVMGNHDVGLPGPDYGMRLHAKLRSLGVRFVENRAELVDIDGAQIIVAGTSDLWQRRFSFEFRSGLADDKPVILLTHNPDMAQRVPRDFPYALMLAGHTHGGQIRLPWPGLTQAVIPTQYPYDLGLYNVAPGRRVFVTPGTGMTGLPMRFRRPPRIDLLHLALPQTGEM